MTTFRTLGAGLTGAVLAVSGAVALAPPASAAPPVAVDDHTMMYPGQVRVFDVLANDSDPDGDDLALCRVGATSGEVEYFVDDDKLVVFGGEDTGEDLTITYYACDFETLVPATLTISFREIHEVRVVKADRPGRLRVTNDNPRAVQFLFGSFHEPRPDGRMRVPAHETVVVRVHRHHIGWVAILARSVLAGTGHVRGIELPGDRQSDRQNDGDSDGRTDTTSPSLTRAEAKVWAAHR